MAGSVNKVILIGNLRKDPQIRRTQDGRPIANLSVATSDTWRDKATGERREKTEWHRVVIFNEGLCRVAEQYLKKGSKVYLEGQLQTRKWQDQSGQDKYTTEVVLQNFNSQLTMLDRAGDRAGGDLGAEEDEFGSSGPSTRDKKPALAGAGKRGDMDDEFPFGRMGPEFCRRSGGSISAIAQARRQVRRRTARVACAAAERRTGDPAACVCRLGRLRARGGPARRTERDAPSSRHRLDLGRAHGDGGGDVVLDLRSARLGAMEPDPPALDLHAGDAAARGRACPAASRRKAPQCHHCHFYRSARRCRPLHAAARAHHACGGVWALKPRRNRTQYEARPRVWTGRGNLMISI